MLLWAGPEAISMPLSHRAADPLCGWPASKRGNVIVSFNSDSASGCQFVFHGGSGLSGSVLCLGLRACYSPASLFRRGQPPGGAASMRLISVWDAKFIAALRGNSLPKCFSVY